MEKACQVKLGGLFLSCVDSVVMNTTTCMGCDTCHFGCKGRVSIFTLGG